MESPTLSPTLPPSPTSPSFPLPRSPPKPTPHQSRLFTSIFAPPSKTHSTPTPLATPLPPSLTPGTPFGFGGHVPSPTPGAAPGAGTGWGEVGGREERREEGLREGDPAAETVRWGFAWSEGTRWLSLPGRAPPPLDGGESRREEVVEGMEARSGTGGKGMRRGEGWPGGEGKRKTKEVERALGVLLGEGGGRGMELISWYASEVREHFLAHVRPPMQKAWQEPIETKNASRALMSTVWKLYQCQLFYESILEEHLLPVLAEGTRNQHGFQSQVSSQIKATNDRNVKRARRKFQLELQSAILYSIPAERFFKTLGYVLYEQAASLFKIQVEDLEHDAKTHQQNTKELFELVIVLREIGLGGDQAQIAFAHAMDKLLSDFVLSRFMAVDWIGKTSVVRRLKQWITTGLIPYVKQIMGRLDPEGTKEEQQGTLAQVNEIKKWEQMAITRLGKARLANLFEYVVNWDSSMGAILDLKEYLTTTATRSHVVMTFVQQLKSRLLHAGASTTHILDVYIQVIRAFNELDPKGVLLEKIARHIRVCLRDRDDTVRIIVASLLSGASNDEQAGPEQRVEICAGVAAELQNPISAVPEDDDSFNDLEWTPDPMDAGADYKKSKTEDILAHVLSLFDREDFIKELQQLLGEHLLRSTDTEFEKETRLLALFKSRFGDDKMQACEVMLRDVLESQRLDTRIRNSAPNIFTSTTASQAQPRNAFVTPTHQPAVPPKQQVPELHAQILSSYFWPTFRSDTFILPRPIAELQEHYGASFAKDKTLRKLHWLQALGRVTVELEFADRRFEAEVLTWQASVIYAFNQEDGKTLATPSTLGTSPITKSVQQLQEQLEMAEPLVRAALAFWVARKVLHEQVPDTYTVIEDLSSFEAQQANQATSSTMVPAASEEVPAVQTVDPMAENRELYRNFILGMLRNQGAMPSPRILMMLKMVLPGGFPGNAEDVGNLLQGMAEDGLVGRAGAGWKALAAG